MTAFEQVTGNLWARVLEDKEVPWLPIFREVFHGPFQVRGQHLFRWEGGRKAYGLDVVAWGEVPVGDLTLTRPIVRAMGEADADGAPLREPEWWVSVYLYDPEGRHFPWNFGKRHAVELARAAAQHKALDPLYRRFPNARVYVAAESRSGRWRSYEVGSLKALRGEQ